MIPGTAKKVLVIDDDIDLLMLLERRLQQAGYEVETAVSLSEAEETLAYFIPQIVLLDININGEDGRKLCFQLKNSSAYTGIRVIIMSGYDVSTSRALLFGADELLAKPLQSEFLLSRMEHWLGEEVVGE